MTHIAIQEKKDGKVVDWMEHVTDEQYRKSFSAVRPLRDRHHSLPEERREAGNSAAHCKPRGPRTTKLYERPQDEISLDEVERILIAGGPRKNR